MLLSILSIKLLCMAIFFGFPSQILASVLLWRQYTGHRNASTGRDDFRPKEKKKIIGGGEDDSLAPCDLDRIISELEKSDLGNFGSWGNFQIDETASHRKVDPALAHAHGQTQDQMQSQIVNLSQKRMQGRMKDNENAQVESTTEVASVHSSEQSTPLSIQFSPTQSKSRGYSENHQLRPIPSAESRLEVPSNVLDRPTTAMARTSPSSSDIPVVSEAPFPRRNRLRNYVIAPPTIRPSHVHEQKQKKPIIEAEYQHSLHVGATSALRSPQGIVPHDSRDLKQPPQSPQGIVPHDSRDPTQSSQSTAIRVDPSDLVNREDSHRLTHLATERRLTFRSLLYLVVLGIVGTTFAHLAASATLSSRAAEVSSVPPRFHEHFILFTQYCTRLALVCMWPTLVLLLIALGLSPARYNVDRQQQPMHHHRQQQEGTEGAMLHEVDINFMIRELVHAILLTYPYLLMTQLLLTTVVRVLILRSVWKRNLLCVTAACLF